MGIDNADDSFVGIGTVGFPFFWFGTDYGSSNNIQWNTNNVMTFGGGNNQYSNWSPGTALIRKQTDLFVLLKSASRNYIIDAISEEIGSHFSKDEIQKYYNAIMDIPYGSLILSIHKKELEKNRVRLGWNQIIEREKKEDSIP